MPKCGGGKRLTAEGEFNSHTINPAPIWIILHRIPNKHLSARGRTETPYHIISDDHFFFLLGAGVSAEHKKLGRPLSDGLICDGNCRE